MLLNSNELKNINGGGFGIFAIAAGIIALIAGIFDGYTRPIKCN